MSSSRASRFEAFVTASDPLLAALSPPHHLAMPQNGVKKHKGAVQLPLVPGRKQESLGLFSSLALAFHLGIHFCASTAKEGVWE
jgi:hypothetical protein